ncbi:flagellar biosynthesis protein FliZ [Mesobacillus subterraneus]|uniref:Flagellar biosynthesis protein FliZ n=2 Tax=Mesobacillus TaxID=2675231 RepID=A0A0D6Z6Y1_9BACI|nr:MULTISPECIES: flagellar biosynthetic protein FliO [Mesobacillus]KIY21529.1 flagellar biosynthesis protein FliZ [Mesobacillus subterraneus]MDQ0412494.1 flagellar protein FliO/FliZ [Mesobacillus stamsii]
MLKLIRTASATLIVLAALFSQVALADAEQLNKSVQECIKNPDACDDGQAKTEANQSDKAQANAQVGVSFLDFVRMILATVFVIALLYFLLKFINKRSLSNKSSKLVENLGGTSLGGNRSVQIVKAGNRLFIVGVGENIQLLKEIEDPKEYDQVIREYNSKMEQLIQPSDLLTKLRKRAKKRSRDPQSSNFSALLKHQLNDMASGRRKMFEEMQKKGSQHDE